MNQILLWNNINGLINQSNIKRYNWKKIFGISLTELITNCRLKGLSVEETIVFINDKLCVMGFNDRKMFENVKISVYARYGEQSSFKKRGV